MEEHQAQLDFSLKRVSPHFGYATVSVPLNYVNRLYAHASLAQQSETYTHGFTKGHTPLAYIEKNFQPHLLEHIKEFFFKYFVIDWLYKEILRNKILIAGEPRLVDIIIQPNKPALYNFSITLAQPIPLQGWKRLPFKAPKRKNYKDLDRQVKEFLKEEQKREKDAQPDVIGLGDWVYFAVSILDQNGNSLFSDYASHLWVKIGTEEADIPFQKLFAGKKIGESFVTNANCLQEYFSSHIDTHYPFRIDVLDFTPYAFFEVEQFKKHFRLRNCQELHQKLIEVFSYRNDISQRRATSEDALKLLLSRHTFEVPNHLVLRQQKEILDAIYDNPDYQVYKMQGDFQEKVRKLATKQVREAIFIHQLGCFEGITTSTEDVKGYLNLTKRPRTKEFIYFEPPSTKYLGQELPVSAAFLEQYCLREKTLNHAIYYLTKQKAKGL